MSTRLSCRHCFNLWLMWKGLSHCGRWLPWALGYPIKHKKQSLETRKLASLLNDLFRTYVQVHALSFCPWLCCWWTVVYRPNKPLPAKLLSIMLFITVTKRKFHSFLCLLVCLAVLLAMTYHLTWIYEKQLLITLVAMQKNGRWASPVPLICQIRLNSPRQSFICAHLGNISHYFQTTESSHCKPKGLTAF